MGRNADRQILKKYINSFFKKKLLKMMQKSSREQYILGGGGGGRDDKYLLNSPAFSFDFNKVKSLNIWCNRFLLLISYSMSG